MKFMLIAFNPRYINEAQLETLKVELLTKFNCEVYFVPHYHEQAKPIYCVQFINLEWME